MRPLISTLAALLLAAPLTAQSRVAAARTAAVGPDSTYREVSALAWRNIAPHAGGARTRRRGSRGSH